MLGRADNAGHSIIAIFAAVGVAPWRFGNSLVLTERTAVEAVELIR